MPKRAASTLTERPGGIELLPSQQVAYDRLVAHLSVETCTRFTAARGIGKTTILQYLARQMGGVCIDAGRITDLVAHCPHGIEEEVLRILRDAFAQHDVVVLDDFDHLANQFRAAGYQRCGSLPLLMRLIMDDVRTSGKQLVLAGTTGPWGVWVPWVFFTRTMETHFDELTLEDYSAFLRSKLGAEIAAQIDVADLFIHASSLNLYDLSTLARIIDETKEVRSGQIRQILDTHILRTNSHVDQVDDISFSDLKGFDQIADALTTHVLNPLKNDPRLRHLNLRPKRGVLLYGPPGTGKTSVGRALARQMQGKFFLIDGTLSPEPAGRLYARINSIVSQAKAAAPSVLFIDDADVLLQSSFAPGLGRYLLSLLDGLESNATRKIAVILTAMNPAHLPSALLRSGRVELWLETRAPPEGARSEIVAAHTADLPAFFRSYDAERINAITAGFNAADMRRLVADVKALFVTDELSGAPMQSADAYFARAAQNVSRNKRLLTLAESGALMSAGAVN